MCECQERFATVQISAKVVPVLGSVFVSLQCRLVLLTQQVTDVILWFFWHMYPSERKMVKAPKNRLQTLTSELGTSATPLLYSA